MWFRIKDKQWHEIRKVLYGSPRAFCGLIYDPNMEKVDILPISRYDETFCKNCRRFTTERTRKREREIQDLV